VSETLAATTHVHADLLEDSTLLRIVLDHPKGNVLDRAVMDRIAAVLALHRNDRHLRLVVLRGAGGHFSFGASVEEHRKDKAPAMLATFHRLVREIAAYPIPIAALVEGRCLGGAFELVLCCHLVFATPTAVFACPEIRLGVFPPVLAAVGRLRLGGALAERLLLTGQEIDVKAAARAGLVAKVLEGDAEPALLAWYRTTLLPLSAFALRQATRAARAGSGLREALGAPLDTIESRYARDVLGSYDGNEGIEAFLAHRTPEWRDE
jgi:cyclohexa-1,5-dienecarbonyl-CoA hydratase